MFLPSISPHLTALGSVNGCGSKGHTLRLTKKREETSTSTQAQTNAHRNRGLYSHHQRWAAGYIGLDNNSVESQATQTAADLDNVRRDRYLENIRKLGYTYLKPPGVSKTMQILKEEEEMEDSELGGGVGDESEMDEFEGDDEFDAAANEQHATEDEVVMEDHLSAHDVSYEAMNISAGTELPVVQETESSLDLADQTIQVIETASMDYDLDEISDDLGQDLDEGIREASDNEYDEYEDAYDEAEYQEGFMVEETYDQSVSLVDANEIGSSFAEGSGPGDSIPAPATRRHSQRHNSQRQHDDTGNSNGHGHGTESSSAVMADLSAPHLNSSSVDISDRSFLVDAELSGSEDMSF